MKSDLEILKDKFPDGVDVMMVSEKIVVEAEHRKTGTVVTSEILLHEIEPETDIYAAMSPKSHTVYVYVGRDAP